MKSINVEIVECGSLFGKSYTVILYVDVLGQLTMNKFYFVDNKKSSAISKAKLYARSNNVKFKMG